jgi:valyl-tRNA synthetase
LTSWPEIGEVNEGMLKSFEDTIEVITGVRSIRKEKNIAQKVQLDLQIKSNETLDKSYDGIILKICNLTSVSYIDAKVDNAFSFFNRSNEYFIPFNEEIDVEAELLKLKEELDYTKGSLNIVMKKLSNERFVNNAPEQVVAMEQKKKTDAEAKIKVLEEKLGSLA